MQYFEYDYFFILTVKRFFGLVISFFNKQIIIFSVEFSNYKHKRGLILFFLFFSFLFSFFDSDLFLISFFFRILDIIFLFVAFFFILFFFFLFDNLFYLFLFSLFAFSSLFIFFFLFYLFLFFFFYVWYLEYKLILSRKDYRFIKLFYLKKDLEKLTIEEGKSVYENY
jgi:hypothetical protein